MKRRQITAWVSDEEHQFIKTKAKARGESLSQYTRKKLLNGFDPESEPETIYVDNPHDLENEQETIPDTKPDTEPTEPENELSEEVRETYRDMESFFNGEQDTKPSSFDSVNWDFD